MSIQVASKTRPKNHVVRIGDVVQHNHSKMFCEHDNLFYVVNICEDKYSLKKIYDYMHNGLTVRNFQKDFPESKTGSYIYTGCKPEKNKFFHRPLTNPWG